MTPSLVVLTDFFAVSNRALSYAAALALPLDAHLVLLHVRHDGLLAPDDYGSLHTPRGEQKTTRALQKLAAQQPVPTEVDISEEFLPDAVQEAVRHHHPLLLVLGRPGSATAPLEIITSTAMDLLRHAPYPLLIVPTVGWDTFPPRRLLLAVDGQPFQLDDNQHALTELLAATDGNLSVVHVATPDDFCPTPAEVLATVRPSHFPALEADAMHVVQRPTVATGVLEIAACQEADMLVVVARRHSLLGSLFHRSITAQLIQESTIPVLLLPAVD